MSTVRRNYPVICALALALSACATQAKLDRQAGATLASYHTTCLKRGLPAGTVEHTECVAALHESDQQRLARLRKIVMAVPAGQDRSDATSMDDPRFRGGDK